MDNTGHILGGVDEGLVSLSKQTLEIGGVVEEQFKVLNQMFLGDFDNSEMLRVNENRINAMESTLNDSCHEFIMRYAPLAGDLRRVIEYIRHAIDMERIGDEQLNLGEVLIKHRHLWTTVPKWMDIIVPLRDKVEASVRNTMIVLAHQDQKLAQTNIEGDREINDSFSKAIAKAVELCQSREINADELLGLNLMARALERIGDHTKNINQETLFAITGEPQKIY